MGFIRAQTLHCSVFPGASRAARGPERLRPRAPSEGKKGAKWPRARGANGLPRPPPAWVFSAADSPPGDSAAAPPGLTAAGMLTTVGAAQQGADSAEGREAG